MFSVLFVDSMSPKAVTLGGNFLFFLLVTPTFLYLPCRVNTSMNLSLTQSYFFLISLEECITKYKVNATQDPELQA